MVDLSWVISWLGVTFAHEAICSVSDSRKLPLLLRGCLFRALSVTWRYPLPKIRKERLFMVTRKHLPCFCFCTNCSLHKTFPYFHNFDHLWTPSWSLMSALYVEFRNLQKKGKTKLKSIFFVPYRCMVLLGRLVGFWEMNFHRRERKNDEKIRNLNSSATFRKREKGKSSVDKWFGNFSIYLRRKRYLEVIDSSFGNSLFVFHRKRRG